MELWTTYFVIISKTINESMYYQRVYQEMIGQGKCLQLKKHSHKSSTYAKATMNQIITKDMLNGAIVLKCSEARSGWFKNGGKGHFSFHPFPLIAQIAPVNDIVCTEVNGDGNKDIILAGNEYQPTVMTGRMDASYGQLLTGNGKGIFAPIPPVSSGLIIDGDVRDLKLISVGKKKILLAAVNDSKMKAYSIGKTK